MITWIPVLIVIICTTVLLIFWFHKAKHLLQCQLDIIDTAAKQRTAFQNKHICDRNNPEITAVMDRCECIYQQAIYNYNELYNKPWIYLPGKLMGFQEKE